MERRFGASYRESSTDEPGLVMDETGNVFVVQPGGARVPVGGGGAGRPGSLEALGALAWTGDPLDNPTSGGFADGTLFGSLVELEAGDEVNGVCWINSAPPSGTAPAGFHVMLYGVDGSLLAVSANEVANPDLQQPGLVFVPFTAALPVGAAGGYYPSALVTGGDGTTSFGGAMQSSSIDGSTPIVNRDGVSVWVSQAGLSDVPDPAVFAEEGNAWFKLGVF